MKVISICIYSYRNKKLYSAIENIIDKSSKDNRLIINIIDQNNVIRKEILNLKSDRVSIIYKYILWDSIQSPIVYKNNFIKKIISDYHLQISDRVTLVDNWDNIFINMCKDNIISGCGASEFDFKNKFMLFKKITKSDSLSETVVMDRDLIFSKTNILKDIGFPHRLKYYGEEEVMSIIAKLKGYKIFSLPSDFIEIKGDQIQDKDYVPFSLYHNYNDILDFYKKNISKLQEFGKMSSLYPIPILTNDVEYDIRRSKIDGVGGKRYIDKTMMVD